MKGPLLEMGLGHDDGCVALSIAARLTPSQELFLRNLTRNNTAFCQILEDHSSPKIKDTVSTNKSETRYYTHHDHNSGPLIIHLCVRTNTQ